MRVPFFKIYHVRLANFHILAFSIKWFPINEIACVRSLIQTKENQNAKKWYIITVISLTWLDLTWLQLTCLLCAKKIGLFALIHGYIKSAVSFYLSLQNTSQHFAANACACMDACVFVRLFVRVGSTFPTIFSLIRPWTMSKKIVKLSLSLSLSCCFDCSNCNWNDNRMCTLCIYTCMQRLTVQHKSAKCHIT